MSAYVTDHQFHTASGLDRITSSMTRTPPIQRNSLLSPYDHAHENDTLFYPLYVSDFFLKRPCDSLHPNACLPPPVPPSSQRPRQRTPPNLHSYRDPSYNAMLTPNSHAHVMRSMEVSTNKFLSRRPQRTSSVTDPFLIRIRHLESEEHFERNKTILEESLIVPHLSTQFYSQFEQSGRHVSNLDTENQETDWTSAPYSEGNSTSTRAVGVAIGARHPQFQGIQTRSYRGLLFTPLDRPTEELIDVSDNSNSMTTDPSFGWHDAPSDVEGNSNGLLHTPIRTVPTAVNTMGAFHHASLSANKKIPYSTRNSMIPISDLQRTPIFSNEHVDSTIVHRILSHNNKQPISCARRNPLEDVPSVKKTLHSGRFKAPTPSPSRLHDTKVSEAGTGEVPLFPNANDLESDLVRSPSPVTREASCATHCPENLNVSQHGVGFSTSYLIGQQHAQLDAHHPHRDKIRPVRWITETLQSLPARSNPVQQLEPISGQGHSEEEVGGSHGEVVPTRKELKCCNEKSNNTLTRYDREQSLIALRTSEVLAEIEKGSQEWVKQLHARGEDSGGGLQKHTTLQRTVYPEQSQNESNDEQQNTWLLASLSDSHYVAPASFAVHDKVEPSHALLSAYETGSLIRGVSPFQDTIRHSSPNPRNPTYPHSEEKFLESHGTGIVSPDLPHLVTSHAAVTMGGSHGQEFDGTCFVLQRPGQGTASGTEDPSLHLGIRRPRIESQAHASLSVALHERDCSLKGSTQPIVMWRDTSPIPQPQDAIPTPVGLPPSLKPPSGTRCSHRESNPRVLLQPRITISSTDLTPTTRIPGSKDSHQIKNHSRRGKVANPAEPMCRNAFAFSLHEEEIHDDRGPSPCTEVASPVKNAYCGPLGQRNHPSSPLARERHGRSASNNIRILSEPLVGKGLETKQDGDGANPAVRSHSASDAVPCNVSLHVPLGARASAVPLRVPGAVAHHPLPPKHCTSTQTNAAGAASLYHCRDFGLTLDRFLVVKALQHTTSESPHLPERPVFRLRDRILAVRINGTNHVVHEPLGLGSLLRRVNDVNMAVDVTVERIRDLDVTPNLEQRLRWATEASHDAQTSLPLWSGKVITCVLKRVPLFIRPVSKQGPPRRGGESVSSHLAPPTHKTMCRNSKSARTREPSNTRRTSSSSSSSRTAQVSPRASRRTRNASSSKKIPSARARSSPRSRPGIKKQTKLVNLQSGKPKCSMTDTPVSKTIDLQSRTSSNDQEGPSQENLVLTPVHDEFVETKSEFWTDAMNLSVSSTAPLETASDVVGPRSLPPVPLMEDEHEILLPEVIRTDSFLEVVSVNLPTGETIETVYNASDTNPGGDPSRTESAPPMSAQRNSAETNVMSLSPSMPPMYDDFRSASSSTSCTPRIEVA